MNGYLRIAPLAAALLWAAPTNATTYDYVGDAYTSNADPTIYGTRMIGSVTFNQDTSNFTGTIYIASGIVAALTLTSGTVTATLPYFDIFADPASPYFSPLFFPGIPLIHLLILYSQTTLSRYLMARTEYLVTFAC